MSIRDRLRHNLPLKLLSLGIALVIWGAVHNQADPLVVRHRAVTVEAIDVPANLAVARIEPTQVTVALFGRASAFDQLEYGGLRLTASVPKSEVGVQSAPLEVEGLPEGLEVRQLSRTMVKVELDAVVRASRPVFVETRGEPASGFAVAASEVRPTEVQISGPSSAVQKVARVVAEVDISGRTASTPATVALSARDANSVAISAVQMEPSQVTVTVQVRHVSSKTVPVVPVLGNVPVGYEVTDISVRPVTATLTGSGRALTALEAVQTTTVSLAGARGRGAYTAALRVPEGLRTVGAASVVVTVELRRQTAAGASEQPQPAPAGETPPVAPAPSATTPPPAAPATEPAPPATPPTEPPATAPVTPARAGVHGRPAASGDTPAHPERDRQ